MAGLTDKIKDVAGVDIPNVELAKDLQAGFSETARLNAYLRAKFIPSNGELDTATKFRVLRGLIRKVASAKDYDAAAKGNTLQTIRQTMKVHKSFFEIDQYVVLDPVVYSTQELKNIGISEASVRSVFGTTNGSSLGIAFDEYVFLKLLNVGKAKTNGLTYAQDLSAKTPDEIWALFQKDLLKLGLTVKFNSGNNGSAAVESLRRGVKVEDIRGIVTLEVALAIYNKLVAAGIQAAWATIEGGIQVLKFLGAEFMVYNEMTTAFKTNWLFWVSDAFAAAARVSEEGIDIRKIGNGVFEMDSKAEYGMYLEETNEYVVGSVTLAAAANVPAVPSNPIE